MKVTRIIHPIGQGAFYSEQIRTDQGTVNVVYDCGSGNKATVSKDVKSCIQNWCNELENKVIDILFISHFHSDHTNGIKTLLGSGVTIKHVVIPAVNPTVITFLAKCSTSKAFNTGNAIVIDPVTIFEGTDTHIIRVLTSNMDGLPDNQNIVSIPFGNLPKVNEIKSGQSIKVFDWVYYPFCDESLDYVETEISRIFSSNRWDINSGDWLDNKDAIKKLKDIYKHGYINLNETSLLVYSTAISTELTEFYECLHECRCRPCHRCCDIYPVFNSCLYTGDITLCLSIVELIDKVIGKRHIGTMQIPHHGSFASWDAGLCVMARHRIKHTTFFLSYGTENKYRHPSSALLVMFAEHCIIPYCVSEVKCTEFKQSIRF